MRIYKGIGCSIELVSRISFFFLLALLVTSSSLHAAGRVWRDINNGLYGGTINELAIDPSASQIVYAGGESGIFKSTNGGSNWSPINNGWGSTYCYALAIDPSSPLTVYAGTMIGIVYKSTDGGGSWSSINLGFGYLNIRSLAIDPSDTQTIYAGTDGGVFKST